MFASEFVEGDHYGCATNYMSGGGKQGTLRQKPAASEQQQQQQDEDAPDDVIFFDCSVDTPPNQMAAITVTRRNYSWRSAFGSSLIGLEYAVHNTTSLMMVARHVAGQLKVRPDQLEFFQDGQLVDMHTVPHGDAVFEVRLNRPAASSTPRASSRSCPSTPATASRGSETQTAASADDGARARAVALPLPADGGDQARGTVSTTLPFDPSNAEASLPGAMCAEARTDAEVKREPVAEQVDNLQTVKFVP